MANEIKNLPSNRGATEPSLKDLLDLYQKTTMLDFNCHHLATIDSFDPTNQTVMATINYKKTYMQRNGITGVYEPVLKDYPILVSCPAIIMSGGSAFLEMPIKKGDTCLMLFNDRDIDNWFQTGQTASISTQRLHSFSDGIALVGLRSMANSIQDYDVNHASLWWKGGGRIAVSSSKVLIENETQNLKELLQELITNVQSLVTATAALTVTCAAPGNPSSIPINVAAITAAGTALGITSTKIGSLLE